MSIPSKDGDIQIGCQGWKYADWVTPAAGAAEVFYPRGTRATEMLEVYARAFGTVEVDSTFYAVPTASAIDGWLKCTPPNFTFSLKLPQTITHENALRGAAAKKVLTEFCARACALESKLASVLIQLPPQFTATPENFRAVAEFLPLLPSDIRFGVEFRDRDWFNEKTVELLARYNVAPALVEGMWVESERVWRVAEDWSGDFAYVRWMGERDLTRFDIVRRARDENLRAWGVVLANLSKRVPRVYAYFSNFYEGHAPASANKLKGLLGQATINPDDLESQPSLF
ncbi:MAG TPA: DUF72 domain-containing protein [Pyrinomonadaceae bacterium]|jgi:uncharacterized protein YecE (DUF72 family)|nr:DUF72 domain-containing protein [Pyrinomonadaceae bacterium]